MKKPIFKILFIGLMVLGTVLGVHFVTNQSYGLGRVYKIAVLLKSKNNAFYDAILDGVRERSAKDNIAITLHYGANEDDWESQANFIKENINQYDGFILVPNRSDKFEQPLRAVQESGKNVVVVDTPVTSGGDFVLSTVSTDNVVGGELAAKFLSNELSTYPTANKCIVHLSGNLESKTHQDRNAGFINIIKQSHPDLKIYTYVGMSSFDEAKRLARDNFSTIRNCLAVYAGSDTMLLGLMSTFSESSTKLPPILIGYDAILEVQRMILAGKVNASVQQAPADMGIAAVNSIITALSGGAVSKNIVIKPKLAVRHYRIDTVSMVDFN